MINGCAYCTAHSCAMLKKAEGQPVRRLGSDGRRIAGNADWRPRTQGRIRARLLRFCARRFGRPDRGARTKFSARLKQHLTPPQIVELACVVGFWKFYNTVHDALKIPVESQLLQDTGYVDLAGRGVGLQAAAAKAGKAQNGRRRACRRPFRRCSRFSHAALLDRGSDKRFRQLVYDLLTLSVRMEMVREHLGRQMGITGPQYCVLVAVAHLQGEAGVSVGALAKRAARFECFHRDRNPQACARPGCSPSCPIRRTAEVCCSRYRGTGN